MQVDIDGKALTIDRTFNHQLWFAAISSNFNDSKLIEDAKFIDKIGQYVQIYDDGVIIHQSRLAFITSKKLIM